MEGLETMRTVIQMRNELDKLVDAGSGEIPLHIGDFDIVGFLYLNDKTQEMDPRKANAAMIEYA